MNHRFQPLRRNVLFLFALLLEFQFVALSIPVAQAQANTPEKFNTIERINQDLIAINERPLEARAEAFTVELAKQREALLLDLLRTSPEKAKSLMLDAGTLAALPASVRPYLERDADEIGSLSVIVEDYARTHRTRLFLKKDGELSELFFSDPAAQSLTSGSQVHVLGKRLDNVLLIGGDGLQVLSAAPVANTFGPQNTAVILVNFQDDTSQPYTAEDALHVVFESTSNFYLENSQNQTWLIGDVFGWLTISLSAGTCPTLYGLTLAVNQATAAAHIDLTPYNRQLYVLPQFACMWRGVSSVGGSPSVSAVNGSLDLKTVGHELGHGLGLLHSHSLDCPGTTIGNNCNPEEYGDRFDIMGDWTASHFNAFQKERLGWLNYGSSLPITTVTTSGTYKINPYETGTGAKAIKVLQNNGAPVGQQSWYYIEYRQLVGFDSVLAQYPASTEGVVIHSASDIDPDSSLLLNMNPQDDTFAHAALPVGQSFVDPKAGVSIETLSANETGATVSIETSGGLGGCNHVAPQLVVTPVRSAPVSAGALVHYIISVTNLDSLACPPSNFLLVTPVAPAGWTAVNVSSYFNLGPGESASTDVQVTSPRTAVAGDYTVTMAAVAWPNFSLRSSTSVTYTISGVPVPDFELSASPSTVTVQRGTSGPVQISSNTLGGFSSAVALSASGLPFGVTAQFTPSIIPAPGSGTASVSFSANASAPLGTALITITGSGGTLSRTVPVSLTVTATPPTLTAITVTPANQNVSAGSSLQFRAMGTFSDSTMSDLTNQVTWKSDTPAVATINGFGFAVAVSAGNARISASLNAVSGSTTLTVTSTPPPPPSNTYTLLGNDIPLAHDSRYAQGVEVGLKFTSDVPGSIVALRFFKSANNFGTHVGELWTLSGQRLASVAFTNETASGWQQVNLATAIPIQASTAYVVSYHSEGPFSYVDFPSPIDKPPLHAPASGNLGGNGVYVLGPVGTFPGLGGGQNYLVDVVFSTGTTTATLTSIAVTPANQTVSAGGSLQFHAVGTYSDNSTNDLTNQVAWSSDTPAVATINNAGFAFAVSAGTAKIYATLNAVRGSTTLTVTNTPPPPPSNTYTLLGNEIPFAMAGRYAQGVELGLKFISDVPGSIVAIRFFKSSSNFGTHVAELWTISGQRLASVPFTGETASGWQQVNLPTAIPIQANTAYVVSYHSEGPFSYVDFKSSIDKPPLHAPASGNLGGNGVYVLGPVGTFPGLGGGQNYLVDVVFAPR